jgi:DnaJ-class molecular chaperone
MPNMVDRRCAYCDGNGLTKVGESGPGYRPCPVCSGSGKVHVPDTYRTCPICGGSGKKNIGEFTPRWVQCKNCQGTGWREPPSSYR